MGAVDTFGPANLLGQFSLSGQTFLHWAAVTLKGLCSKQVWFWRSFYHVLKGILGDQTLDNKNFNVHVLFLARGKKWTRIYCEWTLTCFIVFQFESGCSGYIIRMKMKEELVAWRESTGWQGISTIRMSKYGWCSWIPVINSQWIKPVIKIISLAW